MAEETNEQQQELEQTSAPAAEEAPKRRRTRTRKVAEAPAEEQAAEQAGEEAPKRRRTRARKAEAQPEEGAVAAEGAAEEAPKKRRTRTRKAETAASEGAEGAGEGVAEQAPAEQVAPEEAPKRRRGRPRKSEVAAAAEAALTGEAPAPQEGTPAPAESVSEAQMSIEEMTRVPVLGVVPYLRVDVDDEDSLSERLHNKAADLVDIAVVRVPRLSNFTDFNVLDGVEGVSLRYVESVRQLGSPDLIILPGTKNTMRDLLWLRQNGLEAAILHHAAAGGAVLGICGGYQMLGRTLSDPLGVEEGGSIAGMGLLPTDTVFSEHKARTRVTGTFGQMEGVFAGLSGLELEGYEIHMGVTTGAAPIAQLTDAVTGEARADGG